MEFFKGFLNISRIRPLSLKGDIGNELNYQKEIIVSDGNLIQSIIQREQELIIVYNVSTDVTDNILLLRLKVITSKGILFPEPVLKAIVSDSTKEIDLADIVVEDVYENKGYGSILLDELISIAKSKRFNITGWLSPADSDHIDKLVYFYKKHNFTVSLNSSSDYKTGKILWLVD